jgi:phosphoribosyl-AMP cyclohydrolase / phosphoribosyl-ATP pyrophosphohydrolase
VSGDLPAGDPPGAAPPASRPAGALAAIVWGPDGLVPVVAQDLGSGDVLMVAYADRGAVERTVATGEAHYYSRSRGERWHKGATSGNVQRVEEVRYDCDGDTLLYRVRPAGPACHTGRRSCFFRVLGGDGGARDLADPHGPVGFASVAGLLRRVVEERLRDLPAGSYVARLAGRGTGYVGQKVIEEAGETVVAALQGQDEELLGEAADLVFHLTVLLALRGVSLDDVARVLAGRHGRRDADADADDGATDDADADADGAAEDAGSR